MDGLRYGSSPPRQASFLKAFYERKGEKGAPRPCPGQGCALPAFDTGKRVSNLGKRDHDRTIELALRFRLAAAPLLASDRAPHPIPHCPDLKAPDAIQGLSGLSFHACLCVYLCCVRAAARLGVQSLPCSARPQRLPGQQLLIPIPGDTPKRQRLRPTVTGFRGNFA